MKKEKLDAKIEIIISKNTMLSRGHKLIPLKVNEYITVDNTTGKNTSMKLAIN